MHTLLALLLATSASAIEVGETAPPIEAPEGAGEVRLVNFWASWCTPCREELDLLTTLHERLDDTDASVVTVSIDRRPARAASLLRRLDLDLPVVYDDTGEFVAHFEPPAMPTSYLIDRDGVVRAIYVGAFDADGLDAVEAELRALAAPVPAPPPPTTPAFALTSAPLMSTRVDVLLPEDEQERAEAVFEVFAEVEASASEWQETSTIATVNEQAGQAPVPVSPEVMGLLERGVEIGELTGGAFDITWAALRGLWDFRAEVPVIPDPDETALRAALVDYRELELDPVEQSARLARPGMAVGLGGIAKGHALDRSVVTLNEAGSEDFTLSAGGQVAVSGLKGDRLWRVGIRDPRGEPDDFFALVEVTNASISTSGDYEHFFVIEDVRYHHILDPRTGLPTRGLRSATVIAKDATLADALSTAVMVMGREAGLDLVEKMPGVEAVVVDDEARVFATSGAGLILVHPPAR